MAKLKGLGRGLDALLSEGETQAGDRLLTLPVASLVPGKYQPRTQMDDTALAELAASIRSQGLMQPILARPVPGGEYEIIAGERRWRASQMAGLLEVPVLVRDVPDDSALKMALIENIQREDLNALEEAQGLQRLIDEFDMTHQGIAETVGRSRSAVTNLLRLLNLSRPVQTLVMAGQIDMGHARALLALNAAKQVEAANEVIQRDLSVRATEHLVSRLLSPPAKRTQVKDRDVAGLEESLAERLGAKVQIRSNRKGAGKLSIEFDSLDQLQGLLEKIG